MSITRRSPSTDVTPETIIEDAHIEFRPSLLKLRGRQDVCHFSKETLASTCPPSMRFRLLSRTTGVDQVVDEMRVTFQHTIEMPWFLPGVAPTEKQVEVVVVAITRIRGGKLFHEHVYWNQAQVSQQLGLEGAKKLPGAGTHSNQKAPQKGPADSSQKVSANSNQKGRANGNQKGLGSGTPKTPAKQKKKKGPNENFSETKN